jgi:hypothetical protein
LASATSVCYIPALGAWFARGKEAGMVRKALLGTIAALLLVATASAQQTPGWRFRWQQGQVLTYAVEQSMNAAETQGGKTNESKTKLNLTKRWQVLAIDAQGVATLQLAVTAMRMETTSPGGEVLVFDSANLDKSDPQLKEQMSKYVGQPLAVLRVDGFGQVQEVKESKYGSASKYQNELPFALVLPQTAPAPGQGWQRPYQVILDPPQGAGEKYDAVQKCVCKTIDGTKATITVSNTVIKLPAAAADQAPLLQLQPQGEVVFDTQAGRLASVSFKIDKELKNHQGEGSSYRFQSSYSEQLVANP